MSWVPRTEILKFNVDGEAKGKLGPPLGGGCLETIKKRC